MRPLPAKEWAPVSYAAIMRPEILFPLFAPITSLKGVGPRVPPLLGELAVGMGGGEGTGLMTLVFFGRFADQLEHRHPVGAHRIISGKVEDRDFGRQMVPPDYMVAPEKRGEIPELEAIYPATEGLPARRVRTFALEALERAPELPEWQDPPRVAP